MKTAANRLLLVVLMSTLGCGQHDEPDPCDNDVCMVPMRDGVRLRTRVFLPEQVPPEGVGAMLWRTPYRSEGVMEFMEDIAPAFTERGYAYLAQDVRGRGDSEGEFYPHRNDIEDGQDTTSWMVAQPWSNGRVGTLGGSYPGFTAVAAAVDNPHVYVVISDDSAQGPLWNSLGGLLRAGNALGWFQFLDDLAGQPTNEYDISDRLDVANFDVIALGRTLPVWQDIVAHENPHDTFWDSMTIRGNYERICAPVLNIFSSEPWEHPQYIWEGLISEGCQPARDQHRLVVTPEGHCYHLAALLSPEPTPVTRLMFDFIDKHLGEKDVDLSTVPLVQFRSEDDEVYRGSEQWPISNADKRYYLHQAPADTASLIDEPDADNPEILLDIDPENMSTSTEQYPVARYHTAVLTQSLYLAGNPQVVLSFSATSVDADLNIRLYEYNIFNMQYLEVARGRLRTRCRNGFDNPGMLTPDEIVELSIPLYGRGAHIFQTGSVIALMITGSMRGQTENPHTGEPLGAQTEWLPATYRIHHDSSHPSRLILPILQ
jgi:putative CocE/NonD family hydrolase